MEVPAGWNELERKGFGAARLARLDREQAGT